MSKMASRFTAVTSEEISQINEEAVPEKNEEGDKIRYGIGIYRWDRWKSFSFTNANEVFLYFHLLTSS